MKTAVDSSVLFDIVVVAELGRYFKREDDLLAFLGDCQIDHDSMSLETALGAARIMRGYARNKGPRERTAPDFLIGAHALHQADALLTTDSGFFRHYFRGLTIVTPAVA
jgi:predicted nucleic acid-binding protein